MEIEHLEERIRDFKRREAFWRRMKNKQGLSAYGLVAFQPQTERPRKTLQPVSSQRTHNPRQKPSNPRQTDPGTHSSRTMNQMGNERPTTQHFYQNLQTVRSGTISMRTVDSISMSGLKIVTEQTSDKMPPNPVNFQKSKSRVFEMINKMMFGKEQRILRKTQWSHTESDHQIGVSREDCSDRRRPHTQSIISPKMSLQPVSGHWGRGERGVPQYPQTCRVGQKPRVITNQQGTNTERSQLSQIAASPRIREFLSLVSPAKQKMMCQATQTRQPVMVSKHTQTPRLKQKVVNGWNTKQMAKSATNLLQSS